MMLQKYRSSRESQKTSGHWDDITGAHWEENGHMYINPLSVGVVSAQLEALLTLEDIVACRINC